MYWRRKERREHLALLPVKILCVKNSLQKPIYSEKQ